MILAEVFFFFSFLAPQFIRRPSMTQLSLNLMHGCLSNFGCCFPQANYARTLFEFKKNVFFFLFFLRIFLAFVNIGPYGNGNFKTLLLTTNRRQTFEIALKRFLNFLPNVPHKTTFGIFEIEILMNLSLCLIIVKQRVIAWV